MTLLLDNSSRRLIYHAEHRLFVNAVQRHRTGAALRADYEYLLSAARELQPRLWLNDNRRMGELSAKDAQWLAEDFMPRFAELPVSRCAVVNAPDHRDSCAYLQMIEQASTHISWQERFFSSYEEAWTWLMKVADNDRPVWALSQE